MLVAAGEGFSFADPYAIGLLFIGLAVVAAIGALSHEHDRAYSAAVIYLGLGLGAAAIIELLGIGWLDPIADASTIQRITELAVIIALFSAGLKVERDLATHSWTSVARLLLVAMPLTIGAIALFGSVVMGLSTGAAIALGASLAPTDPVLAGNVGIGPPGEEDEPEPNFSLTAEAGFNDGLAYPFVLLAIFVAGHGDAGSWLGEWALADVLYAIGGGVVIGAAIGYGLGGAAVRLRDRRLLNHEFDGWMAIAAVLVTYGLAEVAGTYGFVAAFVGGLAFRRYEHGHELNRNVHAGAEMAERFGELAVILLLGSLMTLEGLGEPGLSGWLLVPVLLLVVRPLSVLASLARSRVETGRERWFVAWFGVRGIGSLYYAAIVLGSGVLGAGEARQVFWTVAACVAVSIVVHGVSRAPLQARLLDDGGDA